MSDDGVALNSMAHPIGDGAVPDDLSESALIRPPVPFPAEDMARLIAYWHGAKMIVQTRDGMQTTASLHGYGHYGDAAEKYSQDHWQEYLGAARVIMPMIGNVVEPVAQS